MRHKVIGVIFALMALCSLAQAGDEIRMPFPVYVDEFKADLKERGLDFYDNKDSHGFIERSGGEVVINSYRQMTNEELSIIKDCYFKNLRA